MKHLKKFNESNLDSIVNVVTKDEYTNYINTHDAVVISDDEAIGIQKKLNSDKYYRPSSPFGSTKSNGIFLTFNDIGAYDVSFFIKKYDDDWYAIAFVIGSDRILYYIIDGYSVTLSDVLSNLKFKKTDIDSIV